jgi:hypothetical protein
MTVTPTAAPTGLRADGYGGGPVRSSPARHRGPVGSRCDAKRFILVPGAASVPAACVRAAMQGMTLCSDVSALRS